MIQLHPCSHYAHFLSVEAVLVAHAMLILGLFEAVAWAVVVAQVVFFICCKVL
jgi:hypothetical protein